MDGSELQRVLEVAVGGDDSLAAICVDQALQDRFHSRFADKWLNISIFFRRRIDCMIADIQELARRGVEPGHHWWSPDLRRLLGAGMVVLDCFAEMLCTPELRLRRPGDPRDNND